MDITYSHTHIWYFYSTIQASVFRSVTSVVEKEREKWDENEIPWGIEIEMMAWGWGDEQVSELVEFAASRQAGEDWGDCF